MVQRGLVLAGGGLAGIAWEFGILAGVLEVLPDLTPTFSDATLIVGTSAGSVVAAAITSGTDIETLYANQLKESLTELSVELDPASMASGFAQALEAATSPKDARRRIGAMALAAETVSEGTRLAVIAARLPSHEWPATQILLTGIDAATGELRIFDRNSGVGLVDAVAASCAVPGVWPPVTIGGSRYIDGGIRSLTNADLARGADRVLVLTPLPKNAPELFGTSLAIEISALSPAAVFTVHADGPSVAAFGTNPLDPGTRGPAAVAGRNQGRTLAAEVAEFWS